MESLQQLMVVAAVLAAMGGSIWLLQRRGFVRFNGLAVRRPERKLEMIERLQLTPQHSLCLVRMEGRILLISTAPSSCSLLQLEDKA